jgi:hypothetical protein
MSGSKSSSKNTTQTTDARTTNSIQAGLEGNDLESSLLAAGNYGTTNLSKITNTFEDHADNSLSVDLADNSDRSITDNSDNSRSWSDYSDRSFSDSSDNSLKVDLADNSDRSVNDNSSWMDRSDNSLKVDLADNSDRSITDNSDNSHTTINNTDGGAFSLVRDLVLGTTSAQKETFGQVNQLIGKSYDSINKNNDSAFEAIRETNATAIDFVKESGAAMMSFVEGLTNKSVEGAQALAGQSLAGAMNIKAGETISDPADQNLKTMLKAGVAVAGIGGLIYVMRKK